MRRASRIQPEGRLREARGHLPKGAVVAVLAAGMALAALLSLSMGSGTGLTAVLDLGRGLTPVELRIILDVRLPRVLLGLAVGGALGVAGALLQGLFRNPLVEPYTLGISGGAALAVSLAIVLRTRDLLGGMTLPLFAFCGAVLVMVCIYRLGQKSGMLRMHVLLLTGVIFSFVTSSCIMLIMAVSNAADLHGILFWIMGSLDEPNTALIGWAVALSLAGLALSYLFCIDLNALSLGEEEARHLGVPVERVKRWLFVIASLLVGMCVAVSGVIGFVGLVIPHALRLIVGNDHRALLGGSYLAGAAFLIICDSAARTVISPMELPVGVITGIVGGALFIILLIRRGEGQWN